MTDWISLWREKENFFKFSFIWGPTIKEMSRSSFLLKNMIGLTFLLSKFIFCLWSSGDVQIVNPTFRKAIRCPYIETNSNQVSYTPQMSLVCYGIITFSMIKVGFEILFLYKCFFILKLFLIHLRVLLMLSLLKRCICRCFNISASNRAKTLDCSKENWNLSVLISVQIVWQIPSYLKACCQSIPHLPIEEKLLFCFHISSDHLSTYRALQW